MSKKVADLYEDTLSCIKDSEQLDQLNLSIIQLLDMSQDGEIDLILDQPNKKHDQKELFIKKVIDSLPSPYLRDTLRIALRERSLDFFSSRNLTEWGEGLARLAEAIEVVHITVAIEFKPREISTIIKMLEKKIGKTVVLDIKVDHSLIGGAIIQHGNYISDYSLKARLDQFRSSWQRAVAGK
jgi:F-type H+-transporting ATPase subunit delta